MPNQINLHEGQKVPLEHSRDLDIWPAKFTRLQMPCGESLPAPYGGGNGRTANVQNERRIDAMRTRFHQWIFLLVLSCTQAHAQTPQGYAWSYLPPVSTNDNKVWSIGHDGTYLYAGGDLLKMGVARWDGTNWTIIGVANGGAVCAILNDGTDVVVAGNLYWINGVVGPRILKWDGSSWGRLGGGSSAGMISALSHDGRFLFSAENGWPTYIRSWDGSSWTILATAEFGPGTDYNALHHDGRLLYVGGSNFERIQGVEVHNIARWDGMEWTPLGRGIQGAVRAITYGNGALFAAGLFTNAGNAVVANIAQWDGVSWQPLGEGVNGTVRALAHDGTYLYAGGSFTRAGDVAANYVAMWDGENWYSMDEGLTGSVGPYGQFVLLGDAVYTCGDFGVAKWSRTEHQVQFDLTGKGVAIGGGELEQSVLHRTEADPPLVEAQEGWLFAGWDCSLIITNSRTIRAQYLARIPAGEFAMGDALGDGTTAERPVHTNYLSEYYMGETHVTKGQWDGVYAWATNHGYQFDNPGSGKAEDHPVQQVSWYDMVKWCNAKSEMEGLSPAYYTSSHRSPESVYRTGTNSLANEWVDWASGYRLPTEAEWEKAARGGLSGLRFPWGDTIDHTHANYLANGSAYEYDVSPYTSSTYHPLFYIGDWPFTSPVKYFPPNAYGLYDMAGNVSDWCWDWYSAAYYGLSPFMNPRGPVSGMQRVARGGGRSLLIDARGSRLAARQALHIPDQGYMYVGFRLVRAFAEPPPAAEIRFRFGRTQDYERLPTSQRAFIESTEWSLNDEEWHDFRPETLAGIMPLELSPGEYEIFLRQTNTYWKYMATGETPNPDRTYPEFRFHEWPGLETFTVVSGQTAQMVVNLSLHYAWDPPASQFIATDSAFLATIAAGGEPNTAVRRKEEGAIGASGINWEDQIASAVTERELTVLINRVVGNMPKLKASGAIVPKARLHLRGGVKGSGSRWHVLVNGVMVAQNRLLPEDRIGDVSIEFPVEHLAFPQMASVVEGMPPMPVANSIVLVSADGAAWDMLIEQAAVQFNVAPPILFCHGIASNSNSWDTMRAMVDEHLGLPHHAYTLPSVLGNNMGSIHENAMTVEYELRKMQTMFGVEQVNIVAHSKGGLDSRRYTVDSKRYGHDVFKLLQISTPNGGSHNANTGLIVFGPLSTPRGARNFIKRMFTRTSPEPAPGDSGGVIGFVHLTTYFMRAFNENHPPNPSVDHRVITGEYQCPDDDHFGGLLTQSQNEGMDLAATYPDIKRKWIRDSQAAGGPIEEYVRHYNGEMVAADGWGFDQHGQHVRMQVQVQGMRRPNDCWVTVESAHKLSAQGILPYPQSPVVSAWTNRWAEHTTIAHRLETFNILTNDLTQHYSDHRVSTTKADHRVLKRMSLKRRLGNKPSEGAYIRRGGAVYADMLSEGAEKEYRFVNDPGTYMMNFRFVHETGTVSYAIWNPQGMVWTNTDASAGVEFEVSEDGLETWISINQADVAGVWTAKVSGVAIPGESFLYLELLENGGDDIQMGMSLVKETVPKGEPLVLRVELTDQGAVIAGASVEGRMLIVGADDFPVNESFVAWDDGVWPDEVAGDGIYSAALNPPHPAAYQIHVVAEKESAPSFMRMGYVMGSVAEVGTRFTAGHYAEAVDVTGDGLYDELRLHFGVDVARSGTLWVAATVADPSGEWIADCQGSFMASPGSTTLVFTVHGEDVHASRQNGPYRVLNARLSRQADTGDHVLLDEADELFQTDAYDFNSFQHPVIQRTSAATWNAVDTDDDGAYDRLEVVLDIETQPAMAGEYGWRAELTDATGRILAMVEGTVMLGDPENPAAVIQIAGEVIGATGVDGPYTIHKLELWRFAQLQEVFYNVGTSPAYAAADFAGHLPFEPPLPDIRVEHKAESFVLRWPSSTGIWYDVEYAPNPFVGNWVPVTGALSMEATPPENTHELPWHGPGHHWYHYRVKPRRIP